MSEHKFSKQAELDFMHNFSHISEGDRWAKHEIETLRQQLEQAHADIAGLHDQLEEPQIAQDDYRLSKLELEQLRQQVALLREAASAELRGARSGRKELREALAATEPNLQQSRRFTDPVTDDDFLHMIDESNFAQERE